MPKWMKQTMWWQVSDRANHTLTYTYTHIRNRWALLTTKNCTVHYLRTKCVIFFVLWLEHFSLTFFYSELSFVDVVIVIILFYSFRFILFLYFFPLHVVFFHQIFTHLTVVYRILHIDVCVDVSVILLVHLFIRRFKLIESTGK